MKRRVAIIVALAASLAITAAPADGASTFMYETCTFDAASGTLTVTPEVWDTEKFDALDEAWNGSFECGIFEAKQTIQLAALTKVIVRPQTASAYISVPGWLSTKAGHEVDVQIDGRADLPDQRVSVGSGFDEPGNSSAPGHEVHAIVTPSGSDLDADGDLEYTIDPQLEWSFGIFGWRSWGTIDARAFRAPAKTTSSALLFGSHRSTIYAPTVGGGVDINTGDAADTIYGGAGREVIRTGPGNDLVYGGSGNDLIQSGAGRDRIYGQAGRDQLEGGDDNDLLDAGPGDDYAFPDEMRDYTKPKETNDIVRLGGGMNMTITKAGDDQIFGGPATDLIRARGGVLTIRSGAGRDVIDIDGWEEGTSIDCEAGIDWRRYPAGLRFPPQRHCERYTRKDPRRMPWKPEGIGIYWVT